MASLLPLDRFLFSPLLLWRSPQLWLSFPAPKTPSIEAWKDEGRIRGPSENTMFIGVFSLLLCWLSCMQVCMHKPKSHAGTGIWQTWADIAPLTIHLPIGSTHQFFAPRPSFHFFNLTFLNSLGPRFGTLLGPGFSCKHELSREERHLRNF
jgi:hypothetical protein